jgi:hypothetical protein
MLVHLRAKSDGQREQVGIKHLKREGELRKEPETEQEREEREGRERNKREDPERIALLMELEGQSEQTGVEHLGQERKDRNEVETVEQARMRLLEQERREREDQERKMMGKPEQLDQEEKEGLTRLEMEEVLEDKELQSSREGQLRQKRPDDKEEAKTNLKELSRVGSQTQGGRPNVYQV